MYHIPTPEEIRKLRKDANLTQIELAELANVSQSLIARIEKGGVDPRLSTIKRILNAIYESIENKKKAIDFAIKKVITISSQEKLLKAVKLLDELGISQLVVIDEKEKIIGSIREKSITRKLLEKGENILQENVINQLDESLPEISAEASLDEIKTLVIENDAVILVSKGKLRGILTKADIIKSFQEMSSK